MYKSFNGFNKLSPHFVTFKLTDYMLQPGDPTEDRWMMGDVVRCRRKSSSSEKTLPPAG